MQVDHRPTAKPEQTDAPEAAAGTARFIARSLLIASREPAYAALLPAGSGDFCARLLVAAGDQKFVRAAASRVLRAAFQTAVDFLLPGIIPHYLARKRCLEDWLRRACLSPGPAGGHCRQVVVLGAGLDTLA